MKTQAIRFAQQRAVRMIRAEVGSDDTAQLSLYRTLRFKEPVPASAPRWNPDLSPLSMA
jgi:hypothetical protein